MTDTALKPSPDAVKRAAREYLSYVGENPDRILRGGCTLLEARIPAMTVQADVQPVAWVNETALSDLDKAHASYSGIGVQTVLWTDEITPSKRHGKRAPVYSKAAVAALEAERDAALSEIVILNAHHDHWKYRAETAEASLATMTQSRDGYAKQAAAYGHECDRLRASLAECQREKEGLWKTLMSLQAIGLDKSEPARNRVDDMIDLADAALNSKGA